MTAPILVNQWPGTASTASAANKTVSITVSSNANRTLLVWAACTNSTDFLAAATCTVNGASAGSAVVTPASGASTNFVYAWLVVAPASGTYNVVVTPSSAAIFDVMVEEWQGVNQTTPTPSTATPAKSFNAFQTSPVSVTLAPTATSDDVIVDACSIKVTGQTLTPSGTRIGSQINGVSASLSCSQVAGAASSTSWTFTGTNSNVALAAIILKGIVVGGAPTLTSPTGNGGVLTGNGTVTTDGSDGTLWWKVDATSTATDPGAGSEAGAGWTSQSVTATGVQAVASFGALTVGTYFVHYLHVSAASNRSTVSNSASFAVTAAGTAFPPARAFRPAILNH